MSSTTSDDYKTLLKVPKTALKTGTKFWVEHTANRDVRPDEEGTVWMDVTEVWDALNSTAQDNDSVPEGFESKSAYKVHQELMRDREENASDSRNDA